MIQNPQSTPVRRSAPEMGSWVPTATVHIAFLSVAVGLSALVLEPPFWLAIGLLLGAAGTFVPGLVPRGWVILVLAVSQFWREPSFTDPAFYVLLAGVHLLHVLGSLAHVVPWEGRMQVQAFVRPLRRFASVQIVVQAVAVSALFVFREGQGTVRGLSIVTALVLGMIAATLVAGRRRASATTRSAIEQNTTRADGR